MSGKEKFMRRAIEIGRSALDQPGALPYGAVVVRENTIVGEGLNRAPLLSDPTSHGEVEAIREACRTLGGLDLSDCELFTSCEPCAMCTATMYMVGIRRLYYAATMDHSRAMYVELEKLGDRWKRKFDPLIVRDNVGRPIDQRSMPAEELMSDEGARLLQEFWQRQI
jgi:guanine deaminase